MTQPSRWHKFDHGDNITWPLQPGWYIVMVSGDCERDGPHVFYEYWPYKTFAKLSLVDEDGDQEFIGVHDETPDMFEGWYGPLDIPPYDL